MVRINGLRLALAGVFCSVAVQSPAQDWPSRPVKIVVAFSPGGSADHFGRLFASGLSAIHTAMLRREPARQQRRSIGSAQVARADPDGYTSRRSRYSKDLDAPAVQTFIAEEYAHWAPLARNVGLRVQ
jgi:tripartite-type tricarboxylate transporter receptor subunit TctC